LKIIKETSKYDITSDMPIGVFDSGLGGISTLKELTRRLPYEDFIYYGDFANAPYGSRTADEVRELSYGCAERLLSQKVKAIVIACNTATSVSAKSLRLDYPFLPIIGAEPAIKPAVLAKKDSRILVLATEMTLNEEKFKALCSQFSDLADIVPVACPGLVEFVERGETEGEALQKFLSDRLAPFMIQRPDAIVLGCTHYPFVSHAIKQIVGNVPLFDGNRGIANECARRLDEVGMLNKCNRQGSVTVGGNGMSDIKFAVAQKLMELK